MLPEAVAGNTEDEAGTIRKLMESRGWRRIVLVTSAFHMKRSMGLMKKAGVEAAAFPVDYRARKRLGSVWTDWMPGAGALAQSETAVREYIGLLYYAMR